MLSVLRTRLRQRPIRWIGMVASLALAHLVSPARATELAAQPAAVEAAMLRNLARYVTWPPQAFADEKAPWHICVVGADPFGEVLERSLKGRSEQGRGFNVYRSERLADLPTCQIAFLAINSSSKRREALDVLKNKPVLTVAVGADFLEEGGIIRLRETDRVEMSVNLDQARAVSLKIQSKMLEVAFEVLDNGSVRRWR